MMNDPKKNTLKEAEADLKLTVTDDDSTNNFQGKIKVNSNGEVHLEYFDPETKQIVKCDMDTEHPDGIGDPAACQILRQEISKTKQSMIER